MPIGIRVTDLPAATGTLDDDDEFLSLEDGSLRRATRTQAGPKAAIVQVEDAANQFTGTNVEGVLAEIQDNVDALVISGGGIAVASEAEALAGTDNTKAMTPLRVKGVLPWFDVRAYGAVGDGATDDTAAIQAAIDAANAAGGGTVLLAGGPVFAFAGVITVKEFVNLCGVSGGIPDSSWNAGTRLLATNAAARLRFGDGTTNHMHGGTSGEFTVDGDELAGGTNPLVTIDFTVGRTYQNLHVVRSAGTGLAVWRSQNNTFVGCDSSLNLGDGLTLDYGCGGNLFLRFEGSTNGGWGVKVDEALGGGLGVPLVYARPTENMFIRCIWERVNVTTGTTQGSCYVGDAQWNKFSSCTFAQNDGAGTVLSGAAVHVDDGNALVVFEDCDWSSSLVTAISAVEWTAGGVEFRGKTQLTNFLNGFNVTTGSGRVERVEYSNVTNWWVGAPGSTDNIAVIDMSPPWVYLDTLFSFALRISRHGEAAHRYQMLPTGEMQWGGGAAALDTNLYRSGADALATAGAFTIGGALDHDGTTAGFYGTAPVAKQTGVPVTAAGVHAALVALGLISA